MIGLNEDLVTGQRHDRSGKPDKKSDKKLGRRSSQRRSSNARQLGLCISRHDAAEVYSPEVHRHAETNPTCEIHKGYCASQNPSLGYICPGEPHERSPNAPKFEDQFLEETEWQEQGAREAAWKLARSVLKIRGA